jgi:hypothetical protein
MPILDSELKTQLEQNPDAVVNLIVRLKDSPETCLDEIKARGLTVRYTYSLISAVAIQGTASACLSLASEPWVLAIEPDRTVHTM